MNVTIPDLTGAECGDIAITAAEGGIGYWSVITSDYDYKRWSPDDGLANIDVADDFVFYTIRESGASSRSDRYHDITPTLIRLGFERGLALPADGFGWMFQRLLSISREDWTGEIDSEVANVIIQLGAFGEVRYS